MIVRELKRLKGLLNLSQQEEEAFKKVTEVYPFSSTLYYINLAKESRAVRRMLLPSLEEVNQKVQELGQEDPLNEELDKKTPFLTHRYPDRVLIVTTNFCPVLCRYCMRKRNWKRETFVIPDKEIDKALSYIKGNPRIRDVLISGGEPLSLPIDKLDRLISGLKRIETVEVIRIGTRLPVVDPKKILSQELLKIIENGDKIWINTHFNHPDEVTHEAKEAVKALLKAGAPVNNQTVLLNGVNDSPDTLEFLFRKLQQIKVRPYYLFHCDPVKGVIHFSTSITKGLEILRELFKRISPLAIPYYAVDGPGGFGKVPLLPNRFKKEGNYYIFESYNGKIFKMEDR